MSAAHVSLASTAIGELMSPLGTLTGTVAGTVLLTLGILTLLVLSLLHLSLSVTGKLGWHHPLPELNALAVPIGIASIPVELIGGVCAAFVWPASLSTVVLLVVLLLALSLALLFRPELAPRRTSPHPTSTRRTPSHQTSARSARQSAPLTVMSLNCRYGRAQVPEIISAIKQHSVTALCLVEVSDQLLAALDEAGIASLLPHRVVGAQNGKENGGFNVVFSAVAPLRSEISSVRIPAANIPILTLPVLGKRIAVAAAHPYSPQRGAREWGLGIAQLSALPPAVFARQDDALVIAGDFNSNVSHPTFRWLLSGGLLPGNYLDGEPEVSFAAARLQSAAARRQSAAKRSHSAPTRLQSAAARRQASSPIPHSPQLIDSSFEAGKRGVKRSFLSRRFFRSPATFPANWPVLPAMMELDHVLHTDALQCTQLRALRIPGSDHKALLARLEVVKPADKKTAD